MRSYLAFAFTFLTAMSSCTTSPQIVAPSRPMTGATQYLGDRPSPGGSMPVPPPYLPSSPAFVATPYTPLPTYAPNYSAPAYRPLSFGSSATTFSGSISDRTIRARPAYLGGYRLTDDNGNVTRVRPDYLGGYRATDSNGNISRSRPDGFGGFRTTHDDGSVTRSRSDGFGGFRITDDDGNTTRLRSDGFGGYRGYDDAGNSYRIRRSPF